MARQRPHFWDIHFAYKRREWDGQVTELAAADMTFPAEQLHEKVKQEWGDGPARTIGESVLIRPGAWGILDSMLARMRELVAGTRKKKTSKRKAA